MRVYAHTRLPAHVRTYTSVSACLYINVRTYVYVRTRTYVNVCTRTHVCVRAYTYMRTHMNAGNFPTSAARHVSSFLLQTVSTNCQRNVTPVKVGKSAGVEATAATTAAVVIYFVVICLRYA